MDRRRHPRETIGFSVPATVGAALVASDAPFAAFGAAILACGAVEGTVLGLAEAVALRQALPAVATGDWLRATVAGAMAAWVIGLVPFAVELERVPRLVLVAAGPPLAALLLLSIGTLQWRVLRSHVSRAGWWIAASAGAWRPGCSPSPRFPRRCGDQGNPRPSWPPSAWPVAW
jgi:hypothetical protein